MSRRPDPPPDVAKLWTPGGVHELRIPKAGRARTIAGYFDSPEAFAREAARLDRDGHPGIYLTINPVNPDLWHRSANEVKPYAETTTADKDITHRRWLVIDLDPIRPTGIASTDAEHLAARVRAIEIDGQLSTEGWPTPLYMDSGNGAYLLYRVDLPNDQDSANLLHRVLAELGRTFDDETVKVDQTMYNAARIIRVPGTTNRKGSGKKDRPHRVAHLWDPDAPIPTPVDPRVLHAWAPEPAPTPIGRPAPTGGAREYDIHRMLALVGRTRDRGIKDGTQIWELERCPFNREHGPWKATVGQRANGALWFNCPHDSCADNDWDTLRALRDPKPERPQKSPRPPTPTDARTSARQADDGQAEAVDGPPPHANGRAAPASEELAGRRIRLTWASQFQPQPVHWVWATPDNHSGWLALGEITLIAGREGVGKSTLLAWIAAQVTRGTLPGVYEGQPKTILYAASEDSWAHTITPRLIAAGADLDRIARIDVEDEGISLGLNLPRDIRQLPQIAHDVDAAMLMCDPILSLVGGDINPNHGKELRKALEPLRSAAEDAGLSIPALAHFNKTREVDGLSMVAGSRAWVEVARSAILLAWDDEVGHIVMSQAKNNLGRRQPTSPTYTIVDTVIETTAGTDIHIGRVLWGETTGTDAESILQRRPDQGRDATAQILQELSNAAGRPRSPHQIAEATGLNHNTVRGTLTRLAARGQVQATQRRGEYVLPPTADTCVSCNSPMIRVDALTHHPTCPPPRP